MSRKVMLLVLVAMLSMFAVQNATIQIIIEEKQLKYEIYKMFFEQNIS